MKSMTTTSGTLVRWTAQVGFALLLAGFVAVSTLAGAGAWPGAGVAGEEAACTYAGGQWIEVFYPSGALKSLACIHPDGSVLECNTTASDCNYLRVDPITPSKTLPDTSGQVGGDLGLSAKPTTTTTAPVLTAPLAKR